MEEELKEATRFVKFEINLGVQNEEELLLLRKIEEAIDPVIMSCELGEIGSRTVTKGDDFCRISYQVTKFKTPNKTKEEMDADNSSGSS